MFITTGVLRKCFLLMFSYLPFCSSYSSALRTPFPKRLSIFTLLRALSSSLLRTTLFLKVKSLQNGQPIPQYPIIYPLLLGKLMIWEQWVLTGELRAVGNAEHEEQVDEPKERMPIGLHLYYFYSYILPLIVKHTGELGGKVEFLTQKLNECRWPQSWQ